MKAVAQFADADTTVTLFQNGERFHIKATRSDSFSPEYIEWEAHNLALAEAIKAIMLFYVREWEDVTNKHKVAERLLQAIKVQ